MPVRSPRAVRPVIIWVAAARFIPLPDIAIDGLVNYLNINGVSLTWISGIAEWLIFEGLPISIFGGYSYLTGSGSGHADIWLVGLKF
jgi:hypothetical protein